MLVALSLLLFGAALLLAPDWRRQALRAYGFGLLLAGLAVLVAQSIGGDQLVSALATTAAVRPAIAAAWTIATPLLSEAANAVIFYGLAMIAGAWFAGRTRPAVAARRAIAPYARSLAVTYGAFAVVVGLILWWGPTPATRNPLLALILIVLTAGGIEALRRQIVREYPEAERSDTMRWVRGGVDRSVNWARSGASSGRAAVAGGAARVTGPRAQPAAAAAAATTASDARIDQLERLAQLRDAGVLDEGEFAAQKQRILAAEAAPEPAGERAPATARARWARPDRRPARRGRARRAPGADHAGRRGRAAGPTAFIPSG